MTEPQVWTLIGVFAAGMLGTITIVSTLFVRVIRAEIARLDARIGGMHGELDAKITGLRSELKGDIAALRGEVRALDGDVQALMKRTFGIE
ncbi:hypothetical protein [Agromyces archimandritae]|nr:hypothetical protein [Agromyces archimandritae]